MFLSTLGLNEKMVYNWLESQKHGKSIPTKVSAVNSFMPDRARESRFTDRLKRAEEFLDSLPKVPSHYCRADTMKKYIEPVFGSIADLHVEYKRKMDDETEPSIKLFNEMDLRLFKPNKDLCNICCGHDAGTITETDYNEHIKRKDDSRDSQAADKRRAATDINIKSLLVCPTLNASAIYYKMKLSCHNYTVYDLCTHAAHCYFWHECDGALTANVFTSCIIDYLTNSDLVGIDTVIIYSDGPGSGVGSPTVSDIRLLKYTSDGKIMYKTRYDESYIFLPEPRKKVASEDGFITRLYRNKLPIKHTKFQHLQQLKTVIPKVYHSFYDGLQVLKY
ncbi:hypothetical protein MAR_037495 [Mya arenaria]|uniref:Uncharacterized protein n=1 Tax=Mya arenaria TaxID=6604 RepID=A0ABY7FSX0_MYAAR|nr:hypothetical protein MAR_037495 [Mya arenaria]